MGKNQVQILQDEFDGVGRVDMPTAPIELIWPHPVGHPLRHPRIDDPVRIDLRDDICLNGVQEPFLVRVGFHGKLRVLELVDGAGRYNAGIAAQKLMRKSGSKLLSREGDLKVKIKVFVGSDAELLLARQRVDIQPLKKPHSVRVLCDSVVQMGKHSIDADRILETLPRSWSVTIIHQVLISWHTVDAQLRQRFDEDPEVPAGLLPAILKAPPASRMQVLRDLLDAEVATVGGATRALRRIEAQRSVEAHDDDAPDIEHDGLDAAQPAAVEPAAHDSTKPERKPPKRAAKAGAPRTEAVSARLVKRLHKDMGGRSKLSMEARAFNLGAQTGLGREYAMSTVVPMLEGMPSVVAATLAGALWRLGIFNADVQRYAPADALELLDGAKRKPAAAEKDGQAKQRKKKG